MNRTGLYNETRMPWGACKTLLSLSAGLHLYSSHISLLIVLILAGHRLTFFSALAELLQSTCIITTHLT